MNKYITVSLAAASILVAGIIGYMASGMVINTANHDAEDWPPNDVNSIKESLWRKSIHGSGWILPIDTATKFDLKLVDSALNADKRQGSLYVHVDLQYGDTGLKGLVAIRYEKIAGKWHPVFVEDVNTVPILPPLPKEKDNSET